MNSTSETATTEHEAEAGKSLPWLFRLALPYVRRELPMWGKVYALVGGTDEARWRTAGRATVLGKVHGLRMELDLANWSERLSFSLARYHDLPLQLALQAALRPGDTFVDIGANLGLVTLLASRLVGPAGAVLACEPNPALVGRLDGHVRGNRLQNVRIVETALGNTPGRARLHEYAGHSGWGSLSDRGPEGAAETRTFEVAVATGDELLESAHADRPLVLKIDVEGHEVPVLQGLHRTLGTRWPIVFLEVADAHQRRAGFSAAALRREVEQYGYRGFALSAHRTLRGFRLTAEPLETCRRAEVDAVFVPPRGPLAERLRSLTG